MKNKCLNCGKFPFCEICSNMHDEKECFIKRELKNNFVIRKETETNESRTRTKIQKLKRDIFRKL